MGPDSAPDEFRESARSESDRPNAIAVPVGRPDLPLPILPSRDDRFYAVFEQIGAWFSESDSRGRLAYVSPSVESATGYTPDEVIANAIRIHADDLPGMREFVRSVHETGRADPFRFRIQRSDGVWRWIEVTAIGWYPAPNRGFRSVAYNRDVTDVVEVSAALRESEERYRLVAQMSSDMVVEVSADGHVTYLSPGGLDLLGFSAAELRAMAPFENVHPDDRARVQATLIEAIRSSEPVHFAPFRAHQKSGEYVWMESTGLRFQRADGGVRYLGVTRDVTERKREEERLREFHERMQRAQKLEGLGVMAGGIAHDFNNLLTPILGAASLGLADVEPGSPVREHLLRIQRAAQRAAALTNQMLSYAGKSPLLIEPLDLSKLVEEMGQLLQSTVSGKTSLQLDLARGLPAIEADSAQLTQVIVNLLSNAAESMADGGGQISVRTGVVDVGEPSPSAIFADELKCGRHVYFEVADTGCGMDEATLARIFDPFFTTKFTGRGLGLAAVAGIVRGHHGAVEIDSGVGRGTVMRVLFPVATGAIAEPLRRPRAIEPWQASGTALVIDDDAGVRELIREVLVRLGMQVLTANDGREGVEMFRQHAGEIDVVLLDRTMPTASGRQVFGAIRQLDPHARVVLVSGYSQERATGGLSEGLSGFLKKPFTPEELVDRVKEALEA